jgi:hypothetical protein
MKNTIWFAPLHEAVFDGCDQLLEDGEVLSGDLHGVENGPSNRGTHELSAGSPSGNAWQYDG